MCLLRPFPYYLFISIFMNFYLYFLYLSIHVMYHYQQQLCNQTVFSHNVDMNNKGILLLLSNFHSPCSLVLCFFCHVSS